MDSMLDAAKTLAREAKMPWPRVRAVYQNLQRGHHLPTSSGRLIWHAFPLGMAKLLMALAGSEDPHSAERCVWTYDGGRLDGKADLEGRFGERLALLLQDADRADEVVSVDLFADQHEAHIRWRDGRVDRYLPPDFLPDADGERPLITNSGRISGALLVALARKIQWGSGWPAHGASDDELTQEAELEESLKP